MRILEYITSGTMGGAEHGLLMEADNLRKRGHDILFICPRGRQMTAALQSKGFEVWAPRTYGKLDPWTLLRVAVVARRRRIQVIHTHLSTASLIGSLAGRLAGVSVVATVHGLNSAFCYRFAPRIIAVSAAVRQHLTDQGLPGGRITVIPNGVDVQHFAQLPLRAEARCATGIDAGELVLLYAGRLSLEKGVNLLPALLAKVLAVEPRARLVILGQGFLKGNLEQGFANLGISNRVLMAGYQPDTRPYLSSADVMVLPSYKEGLPRSLLEAMASGLPAVGTRAGGIPEAIIDNQTGYLVPVGDVDALADRCAALLANPDIRARMASAAQERVLQFFSVQGSITILERVLSEEAGLR